MNGWDLLWFLLMVAVLAFAATTRVEVTGTFKITKRTMLRASESEARAADEA